MNGKVARACRKVTGFRPNMVRNYKVVEAAIEQVLELCPDASAKHGEPRFKLKPRVKYVYFQNDASRAVYRKVKKDYTHGRIKK